MLRVGVPLAPPVGELRDEALQLTDPELSKLALEEGETKGDWDTEALPLGECDKLDVALCEVERE